jgi:hypothetical protein
LTLSSALSPIWLVVDAIAGEDPHDSLSRNLTASMLEAALADGPVPRLAYTLGPFEARAEPATRARWMAPFNHPTRAAVAPEGEIYVADGCGNARIHRFSPEDQWRASFGEVGQGPGEFMTPHSLIVNRENRLVVYDRENDRVQLFNRDGRWPAERRGLCRPMPLRTRRRGHPRHRSGSERERLCAGRDKDRARTPVAEWCARHRPGQSRRSLSAEIDRRL